MSRDLSAVARGYARRGWAVFPLHTVEDGRCSCGKPSCGSPGKHPLADLAPHGVLDATTDPMAVAQWWALFPDASIGVATGTSSGVVVLDVDDDAGGWDSLDRLQDRHGELTTWAAATGGGGVHLYFHAPAGVSVRSSASAVAPGIDVRGDGGYVVAPPSPHASGEAYRWSEASTRSGRRWRRSPAGCSTGCSPAGAWPAAGRRPWWGRSGRARGT